MTATPQRPDESSPESRGAAARNRVEELRRRRTELAEGRPPSLDTVRRARVRAQEALERAIRAHEAAAVRHRDASEAHRRAAAVHEEAAVRAGDGNADQHQDAAYFHRLEAERHAAASELETGRGEDDAGRRI